jgi:hypothetical protein
MQDSNSEPNQVWKWDLFIYLLTLCLKLDWKPQQLRPITAEPLINVTRGSPFSPLVSFASQRASGTRVLDLKKVFNVHHINYSQSQM